MRGRRGSKVDGIKEVVMAARIGNIALDCDDVLKVAAFWSAVLGRGPSVTAAT
jgi:hypothetical protein